MHTVQIEHPIRDFDGWKAAFDRVRIVDCVEQHDY